jgi:hypothetical protein
MKAISIPEKKAEKNKLEIIIKTVGFIYLQFSTFFKPIKVSFSEKENKNGKKNKEN